ncbi:MAG TPA: hypothetical protein VKU40_17815, partial [Thermoanaerobaculia bacterium]|nr:hypothetical protein [Thermoanaerobaculia bacterium]
AAGAGPDEARARTVLARCLRVQGKLAAAAGELRHAAGLPGVDEAATVRLPLDLERSRLAAAEGGRTAALRILDRVAAEAGRLGLAPLAAEAAETRRQLGLSPQVAPLNREGSTE